MERMRGLEGEGWKDRSNSLFGWRDKRSFQIEHAFNKPPTLIEEPEVVEAIGWCDKEAAMFDYKANSEREGDKGLEFDDGVGIDSHEEDDGLQSDDGHEGVEGLQSNDEDDIDGHEGDDGLQFDDGKGVHIDDGDDQQFEFVVRDDELTKECMALFEGYCARHIYANFKLSYLGDNYKRLFWKACRSCNVFEFKAALNAIGDIEPRLLEFIREMVMRKFQERNEECATWRSVLPPRVDAKILKNNKQSRMLTIIAVGDMEYELLGPDGSYVVKLIQYNCWCGIWQISYIPCCHAMPAISHSHGRSSEGYENNFNNWSYNFTAATGGATTSQPPTQNSRKKTKIMHSCMEAAYVLHNFPQHFQPL
ncbi:hypothetical protein Ddye_000160 [Dipteronia dyeriana]|uniref:SWIM-type domain-containing protein n=1 Tax=Dipteronia dyeriana TaxID=168575 RepID=A0AAE0CSA7_9ROSI|nr:hypothetical protein Ddye_000160 [Dipteronia dyeriana]